MARYGGTSRVQTFLPPTIQDDLSAVIQFFIIELFKIWQKHIHDFMLTHLHDHGWVVFDSVTILRVINTTTSTCGLSTPRRPPSTFLIHHEVRIMM
jgi:hypothetical protein